MAGVTGRVVKAAYARTNTWGTPASVTQQLLMTDTSGLDSSVVLVDDETFNQSFLGTAEPADHAAIQQELPFVLRYENLDRWIAAGMGSATAPVVVSSVAADSLIAYRHVVDLAPELPDFWYTLAIDTTRYILEIPSLKVRGYTIRVGDNGRMMVNFPIVGNKATYDSTVNVNSTVGGATAASIGNRVFRKDGRFRMNVQSGGSLAAADVIGIAKEITFNAGRPLASDDHVFNQDYIIAPDDDGYPEYSLEVTYARMNTIAANSLAIAITAGRIFKADLFFTPTSGGYINSETQRSLLWQFPALQLYSFRAAITGPNQTRPVATFRAKLPTAAPTGMTGVVTSVRVTMINGNSATLP
jgi:hypothetical protein